jgi:hypothetical protein
VKTVTGKSRWGMGIAALYISFVVFILACVGFATLQNYDLVEKDYYDKGVAYQGEIDRFTRTARLSAKPSAVYHKGSKTIALLFPSQLLDSTIAGSYQMMRPSDASLDTTITLVVDTNGVQVIDASLFEKGLWRTTLIWSGSGVDYAIEAKIVVE